MQNLICAIKSVQCLFVMFTKIFLVVLNRLTFLSVGLCIEKGNYSILLRDDTSRKILLENGQVH